jgi:hypothetical protein
VPGVRDLPQDRYKIFQNSNDRRSLPRVILPAFKADQKSVQQTAQLTHGSKMEIPVDALPAVLEPLR